MYSSIYRVQSSTRRLPIRALFGFTLKQSSPVLPSLSESPSVVVCPGFALGRLTGWDKPRAQITPPLGNGEQVQGPMVATGQG